MQAHGPRVLAAMARVDYHTVNLVLRIDRKYENKDQQGNPENITKLFHLLD
jgi:hypothetical protein